MEIYVIRHTQVAISKNICYGQTDVPLNETFIEEMRHLKEKLPNDFTQVYSSPLSRCKELAENLKLGNIQFENDLMEVNFGEWENMNWKDINQIDLNIWMNDFVNEAPPKGESLQSLYNRIENFLNKLNINDNSKLLLITHAGVIRCIWAYLLKIPLENIFKIPIEHEEVFAFSLHENSDRNKITRLK